MPLLKFTRKKRIVPISATTDIVVVDSNGYIGEKRPNGNTVYFGYLDSFADYSQAGLGQVTIIPNVIGKVTIGGREYKTTKIGNQEWLAENLDWKFPGVEFNPANWPGGGLKCCYYNFASAGTPGYGLLYTWDCAKYLEDNKATMLPSGWHIPTESDYNSLASTFTSMGVPTNTAGLLLKSTSNWSTGYNGIDYFEFKAFGAGMKNKNNSYDFFDLNVVSTYWTTKLETSDRVYGIYILGREGDSNLLLFTSLYKDHGMSIRLVRTLE